MADQLLHSTARDHNRRNGHGRSVVLAEPLIRKLDPKDILALVPQSAPAQHKLFAALVQGPIALFAAMKLTERKREGLNHAINALNDRLMSDTGVTDAIVKERLADGNPASFVMRLNPAIFLAPENQLLKPGITALPEDIFQPAKVSALRLLAKFNFSDVRAIAGRGITRSSAEMHITDGGINRRWREVKEYIDCEPNDPVVITRTQPYLCYVSANWAQMFGVKLEYQSPRYQHAFSSRDSKFIDLLLSNGGMKNADVVKVLGIKRNYIKLCAKRINERCGEFGWPEAIVISEKKRRRIYMINEDFVEHLDLCRVERKKLETYFTPSQTDIIRHTIQHPLSSSEEILKSLGISSAYFHSSIRAILAICAELGKADPEDDLADEKQLLLVVRNRSFVYRFSEEFCRMFGEDYVNPEPKKVITNEKLRRAYLYLVAHPGEPNKESARALRMKETELGIAKLRINRKLVAAGLEPLRLSRPHHLTTRLRYLRDYLVSARKREGDFPSPNELVRRANECNRVGPKTTATRRNLHRALNDETLLKRYRTVKGIVCAAKHAITDEQKDEIHSSDRAALNKLFTTSGPQLETGELRSVGMSVLAALTRGVPRTQVVEIIRQNNDAGTILSLLNGLNSGIVHQSVAKTSVHQTTV
ncbi:MAG: hypothetical protein ABID61_02065 [Candidatus Micrarchaeota archaeon]